MTTTQALAIDYTDSSLILAKSSSSSRSSSSKSGSTKTKTGTKTKKHFDTDSDSDSSGGGGGGIFALLFGLLALVAIVVGVVLFVRKRAAH